MKKRLLTSTLCICTDDVSRSADGSGMITTRNPPTPKRAAGWAQENFAGVSRADAAKSQA